jgi:hypothetical protein
MNMIKRSDLKNPPRTNSPLEFAYALMREAEVESDMYRAMDLHQEVLHQLEEARECIISSGMAARIGANQTRLGIW